MLEDHSDPHNANAIHTLYILQECTKVNHSIKSYTNHCDFLFEMH